MAIIKNPLTVVSGNDNTLFKKLVDRSITKVTAEDLEGVTNMGTAAFSGCTSLTSITIPDSVTSIGNSAFSNCSSLTSINIPNSVTSLGDYAFAVCSSLTSITIPDSITSIGRQAFYFCTSLTSIIILATTPPILGNNVFNSTNDCPIYVPAESVETYKTATNWSTYANRIQAIPQ